MMKTKILLSLFILFEGFSNVYAQQLRQKSGGIQTITVRRGEANNLMPTPSGKTLAYFTPEVSQNVSYQLNFSEYINGERQEDDLSEIMSLKLVACEKAKRFQIVPDVSRENHFILFSFVPMGMMRFSHRFSEKNVKFEYLTFKTNEKQSLDVEVPLLVVFESKTDLDYALESLHRKTGDALSEIDFKKLTSTEFPVKRVSVLYYVLKKEE